MHTYAHIRIYRERARERAGERRFIDNQEVTEGRRESKREKGKREGERARERRARERERDGRRCFMSRDALRESIIEREREREKERERDRRRCLKSRDATWAATALKLTCPDFLYLISRLCVCVCVCVCVSVSVCVRVCLPGGLLVDCAITSFSSFFIFIFNTW